MHRESGIMSITLTRIVHPCVVLKLDDTCMQCADSTRLWQGAEQYFEYDRQARVLVLQIPTTRPDVVT